MLPPPPQSTLFPYTTLFRSATGLAITSNEALRLVAREVRLHILVVVHRVAVTLEPDRGRGLHLFAALERQHRVALAHVGFALPIGVLARDHGLRPFGRIGARQRTLGMAVAAERIDDRPRHHDAAHARAVGRRACRPWERGVARIVGTHGSLHREQSAAPR